MNKPPQDEKEIRDLLYNLKVFMHDNDLYDPLIQMALIHFQFESIHPFYDANGRTGRILIILYLVLKGKIQEPILYLSKYIIENKAEYYLLLKKCNNDIANILDFVMYMLKAVAETAQNTKNLILKINEAILTTKKEMKNDYPIFTNTKLSNIYFRIYTLKTSYLEKI
ncbi:Fic family protein [Acholeplasma laidlawii]|uniref:Fic family protein n=1 Tax=Acholeplasma laidlawii TaxID=2148 RepID=UPI002540D5CD|nr:Fic family protein [Acholeplasma laidlawii]